MMPIRCSWHPSRSNGSDGYRQSRATLRTVPTAVQTTVKKTHVRQILSRNRTYIIAERKASERLTCIISERAYSDQAREKWELRRTQWPRKMCTVKSSDRVQLSYKCAQGTNLT